MYIIEPVGILSLFSFTGQDLCSIELSKYDVSDRASAFGGKNSNGLIITHQSKIYNYCQTRKHVADSNHAVNLINWLKTIFS